MTKRLVSWDDVALALPAVVMTKLAATFDALGAAAAVTPASIGAATPASVTAAVAALVNAAPGAMDTLGEIAAVIASDESAAAALLTSVAGKATIASLTAETTRATTAEGANTTAITAEASTARAAEAKAVPRWAASTAYTAGQQVVSPNNDVVSRITAGTSGATYDPTQWVLSATYAPGALTAPAVAALAAKRYDPARNLYNGAALRNWRAALARQATGGGFARLNCYGDSMTFGYVVSQANNWQSSWATRLRNKINTKYGNAGTGVVYLIDEGDDTRIVKGGAALVQLNGAGPFDFAMKQTYNNVATIAFTPDVPVDTFTVYYLTSGGGGGVMGSSVDGGSNTPLSCNGAVSLQVTSLPSVTLGTHTLNIATPAAGGSSLFGFEGKAGTSGVRVTRCGKGGATPTSMVGAGEAYPVAGSMASAIDLTPPDLAIFMFNANDFLSHQSVATFTADLTTLILRAKAVNASVLLIPDAPNSDIASSPAQAGYVQAMYSLADLYGCAVLDLADRWGSYAISSAAPLSFYCDVTHPSDRGYQDIANAVYDAVVSG